MEEEEEKEEGVGEGEELGAVEDELVGPAVGETSGRKEDESEFYTAACRPAQLLLGSLHKGATTRPGALPGKVDGGEGVGTAMGTPPQPLFSLLLLRLLLLGWLPPLLPLNTHTLHGLPWKRGDSGSIQLQQSWNG